MKKTIIAIFVIAALGCGGVLLIFRGNEDPRPDMIALNSAMIAAMRHDDEAESLHLMSEALLMEAQRVENEARLRNSQLQWFLFAFIGIFGIAALALVFYLDRTILRPFRNLETFASRVAQGDLNYELEMDKGNRFGAFSESFDLMRHQLEAARENERLANISKKELVASLSHDVKTPVSSIKIITELYQAKHGTTAEMESIARKADQIDLLISNMFTATMEELKQLKVSPSEVTTIQISREIRESDYQNKIRPFSLPECVVTADMLRFRQVIDNVLGNSYKYADTDIEITGSFDGDSFVLAIRDFGNGVSTEELALLCEKFYRAENAQGKSGAGLGLYLSKYFITEMGGSLTLENKDGFWVIIRLKM